MSKHVYPRRWTSLQGDPKGSWHECGSEGDHLWIILASGERTPLRSLNERWAEGNVASGQSEELFLTGDGQWLPLSRYPRRWRNIAQRGKFYQIDRPQGEAFAVIVEDDGTEGVYDPRLTKESLQECSIAECRIEVLGVKFRTREQIEGSTPMRRETSPLGKAFLGSIVRSSEARKTGGRA